MFSACLCLRSFVRWQGIIPTLPIPTEHSGAIGLGLDREADGIRRMNHSFIHIRLNNLNNFVNTQNNNDEV